MTFAGKYSYGFLRIVQIGLNYLNLTANSAQNGLVAPDRNKREMANVANNFFRGPAWSYL